MGEGLLRGKGFGMRVPGKSCQVSFPIEVFLSQRDANKVSGATDALSRADAHDCTHLCFCTSYASRPI